MSSFDLMCVIAEKDFEIYFCLPKAESVVRASRGWVQFVYCGRGSNPTTFIASIPVFRADLVLVDTVHPGSVAVIRWVGAC